MKYDIIIPAYNEEKIIYKNGLKVYYELKKIQQTYPFEFTLSLFDDGSTDNTLKEIKKLSSRYDDIVWTTGKKPSRRENLIYYMTRFTKGDYIGFMDCDLSTDLKDLKNMIMMAPYYDVISGSRYLVSSQIERKNMRHVISWVFNNMIRMLFNSKIRDHECGFKIFNKKSFDKLTTKTGFFNNRRKMFWDTEMWVYAQQLKMKILEIPITWKEGDKSALRFKTELSMLPYIFMFWVKRKWTKKN